MSKASRGGGMLEIAIMKVGNLTCGIDTSRLREINRMLRITTVHGAPDYIRGVTNLRGQIVTVIDLRRKFGLVPAPEEIHQQIVVVCSDEEDVGLLVDHVEEVVTADSAELEPPPPNVGQVESRFFECIFKMDRTLIAILDTGEITALEKRNLRPGATDREPEQGAARAGAPAGRPEACLETPNG